jgi:PAS domain S-box-containing protein
MQSLLKYGLVYLVLIMTSGTTSAADDSLEYFRDTSSQMSYQDVLNNNLAWQTIPRNKANFGFTSDALWLRLPINNPSSSSVLKHLRINYPLLDHVDAYLVHKGQTIEHKYLSDLVPYDDDRQHDKYYLFNYTLPAETHYWVYLRIETQSSMTLPIEVFHDAEYLQQKTLENYWFGALYGTLIIMGLYNLILAITLRSLVYLLYVGYLSGFTFLISALNGDGFQYIWSQYPIFNNQTPLIGAAWPSLFTLPLAYYFLRIKHYAPKLATIYKGLYLIVLISIPSLFFIDYQAGSKLMNGINIILSPIILLTALYFSWHKRPGAKTFALAWLALVISLTLLSLSIYNIIPSSGYTRQAYSFGGLLELVIISLALARQINQSIHEKNQALKQSEINLSKYQDIFHNSPAGIFTARIDGKIINHNNAFNRIMRLETFENSDLNIFKNISKDPIDIPKLITHLELGRSVDGLPLLCVTAVGKERWLAITLSLQGEAQNRTIEGHITDIHDRMSRQHEKEEHDRQRMDSLKLLIAGIAHEINTPLGNNLTTLSFVDEIYHELDEHCTNSQKTALEHLNTSFEILKHNEQRISQLVKRFTMVSTGYLQATPVAIEGEAMLQKVAINHLKDITRIKINTYYDGPETFISYEDPLIIILEGLIDNSIKHGLSDKDNGKIEIELLVKEGRCEINYHDNGKGVNEDIIDKIFQPFFTTSRGSEETSGLGLYAIDNIVTNLFHGSLKILNGDNPNKPGFHLHIKLPQLENIE